MRAACENFASAPASLTASLPVATSRSRLRHCWVQRAADSGGLHDVHCHKSWDVTNGGFALQLDNITPWPQGVIVPRDCRVFHYPYHAVCSKMGATRRSECTMNRKQAHLAATLEHHACISLILHTEDLSLFQSYKPFCRTFRHTRFCAAEADMPHCADPQAW